MFAISFAMLFGIAFISIFNVRLTTRDQQVKNLLTWVMCACNSVLSITIAWLMIPGSFWDALYPIITDPRMITLVVFEFLALLSARRNFTHNHDNITAINFSMFMSIVYVPILAYFLTVPIGFQDTLVLNYASDLEFLLFVGSMPNTVSLMMQSSY